MSRNRILSLLVVSLALIAVFGIVEAMIKVDGRTGDEYVCSGSTDPYCLCMAQIGDTGICNAQKTDTEGTTTSWGTRCDEPDLCKAWIQCPNGTTKECVGEYEVKADDAGISCQDTGDDTLMTTDYCPN